jgi:hypothetical protein
VRPPAQSTKELQMTTTGQGGSAQFEPSPTTSDTSTTGQAKEQASQAAGAAADETKHVAGVAQQEAQKVASEAKSQVQDLLGEALTKVEEQSRTQRDRVTDTLGSLGDDLEKMASQTDGGLAADLAREASDRVRSVSAHLEGREPRDLLDDVRDFARRRPGVFLGGALVAGLVAGRLTRGAREAKSGSGAAGGQGSAYDSVRPTSGPFHPTTGEGGTAAGTPLAGTGRPTGPVTDPVDPTETRGSGLPNPAGSVTSETTWADTGARGDLS